MAGSRDQVVITSKVWLSNGPDAHGPGSSRRNIMGEIEESLTRLGTDHLDVYFRPPV